MLRKSICLFATALSLLAPSARPAAALARNIADNDTVVLTHNVHPDARREFDAGGTDYSLPMSHMVLALRMRAGKQAALDRYLHDVQEPASASFHKWLTPEDFADRFGADREDVDAVTGWLASHGFVIENVSRSRTWVNFSGPVATVERAFRTQMHDYYLDGKLYHANAVDPSIPRGLSDVISGIVSLHNFPRRSMIRSSQPAFTSGSTHYLSPGDFAAIYNVNSLYDQGIDGTGQTIAIVGRTHPSSSDWTAFRSTMGLSGNPPQVIVNGTDPGDLGAGEDTEADLDVEWSGAVAKNATIAFVVSRSTSSTDGIDLSSQYIVDNNLAPVMSVSFGQCEALMGSAENTFYTTLWQQAAAQGITVFVASGDSGAAGCSGSGPGVNGLGSTPYNIAVGGTQLSEGSGTYWNAANGTGDVSAMGYIPETAWNENGIGSSGGGVSIVYSKPSWQAAPGVPSDGKRDVPDVSLSASVHDGYLIQTRGKLLAVGGTSAASPAFAGLMALVVQKTGERQGNANPVLYQLGTAQYGSNGAKIFHDITSGNNSVAGVTGYSATAGYDLVTGLGSVDATALVNNWAAATDVTLAVSSFTLTSPVNTLTVPVSSFTANGSNPVTGYMITATAAAPAVTATGWLGAPPAAFTVKAAGSTTLYAWVKDSLGNISQPAPATVTVDQTKPVVSTFAIPASISSLTIPVTAFTATDNTGVTGYLITTTSTVPLAAATGWSSSAPTGYTVAAAGALTLYAWARDGAGNVSAAKTATAAVDMTIPVVTVFTLPAAVKSLTVTGIAVTATDNVGVAAYQITANSTAPTTDDTNWTAAKPAGYTFASDTADGLKTLYAWAKDKAGNVSLAKSATVTIDTAVPQVNDFTIPATSKSLTVAISTFVASDSGSGPAGYQITTTATAPSATATGWSVAKPASFKAAAAGATTLYAWVKDAAGNVSTSKSAQVLIDTAKPSVSAFTVTPLNQSLTIPVSAFTATDDTGVTGYMITATPTAPTATATTWSSSAPTGYTAAKEGALTLYAWARDVAGNVSVAKTATATADKTVPVVTAFTLPAASKSLTVPVTTLTATDNVSVAAYQITATSTAPAADDANWTTAKPTGYTLDSSTQDGSVTLYAWAKDTVGNVSLAKSATVIIDTVAPVVTAFTVPAASTSLTVPVSTFTATDNTDVTGYMITATSTAPSATATGWSTARPVSFKAAAAGTTILYACVKDRAGNVSAPQSAAVSVQK